MEGIKKRVGQMAEIKAVTVSANMAEYNEANGTERAVVEFVYCSDNTDGVQALLGSLVTDSSNRGNVVIDLSGRPGNNMDDKLADLREALVGQKAQFTTYVVPVALLNDDGYDVINNGVRDYSSLTAHYLGMYDDEEEVVATMQKRFNRQLENESLFLGSIDSEVDVPQQPQQRRRK